MEKRGDRAAARQDERLQRGQVGLAFVDRALEYFDLRGTDADHAFPRRVGRGGELAAEIEELVLHLAENDIEALRGRARGGAVVERAYDAEDGV